MSKKYSPISQEGCWELLLAPVWELLVEEAEKRDDANLGQRATAKNVARLDRSWYTIQAGDLRHFIICDCHGICSLAEAGKVLQVICGYQRAVGRKKKS